MKPDLHLFNAKKPLRQFPLTELPWKQRCTALLPVWQLFDAVPPVEQLLAELPGLHEACPLPLASSPNGIMTGVW